MSKHTCAPLDARAGCPHYPGMPSPFATLTQALDALHESDLVGDLTFALGDASGRKAARMRAALDSLQCAESVETLSDFAANLREAQAALGDSARAFARRIARMLEGAPE